MENKEYTDNRGTIKTWGKEWDILTISSRAGSRRADHYHKESGHFCIVTKGQIKIFERPVGKQDKPRLTLINKGDCHWTGPMVEHVMLFDEPTEFICLSNASRKQEDYENDLVRIDHDLVQIYYSIN